uniref:Uncharacterized protein n=1 Tax=Siphoviridae sp. ctkkB9 TaxID=2825644 RepID=A0A8S5TZH0_9CAUD|nr:MAG TPA: hypothetical protein [Siphoviridae sp. ctkkB9]
MPLWYHVAKCCKVLQTSNLNRIFRQLHMINRTVMPTIHRSPVSMEFVPNLFPCQIMNITVTQHHAFIRISHFINNLTDLLLQIHQLSNFGMDFILQIHNLIQASDKRSIIASRSHNTVDIVSWGRNAACHFTQTLYFLQI